MKKTIRFSAIGLNHGHIYSQVNLLIRAGAELISFYSDENELAVGFQKTYPWAKFAAGQEEILNDPGIDLVVSASIPSDRAPLGIKVMREHKDFMSDKPGFTSLQQLDQARQVQQATGQIYSIYFSERFEVRAAVKASQLIQAGAIGNVVHTIGLGPHRLNRPSRPGWFFNKEQTGGVLNDLASHQIDQFLHYTGSKTAEVVASQVGNHNNPDDPGLEDFGEILLRGDRGSGYIRVDWLSPDGLGTWGDGRAILLGTEGYIEIRKYIDLLGRPGEDHLFIVDQNGTQHVDCSEVELPYGKQLLTDIEQRTETAMSQQHAFLASDLALQAELKAGQVSVGSHQSKQSFMKDRPA